MVLKVEADSRFKKISACLFFVKNKENIRTSFPEPQILLSQNFSHLIVPATFPSPLENLD